MIIDDNKWWISLENRSYSSKDKDNNNRRRKKKEEQNLKRLIEEVKIYNTNTHIIYA